MESCGFFVRLVGDIVQNLEDNDRRIFERFCVKLLLKYCDLNSDRERSAQTIDISANGIGLVTSRDLFKHAPLEMWISIPDKGQPLYTRGEVIWSSMIEPNKCRVGVKLEKADLMGFARVLRITGTNQDNH